MRVTHVVEPPGTDLRLSAELAELLSEPLGVDRPADLVAEDQVQVDIGLAGEFPLEELPLPMRLDRGDRVASSRMSGESPSSSRQ